MSTWSRAARLAAVTAIAGCLLPPAVAGAATDPSTNVNMVGEAFTIRQDGTVPTDLLLARYPRAATEVSDDLSTGFAAFADPGFLGRFGIGAGFAASGKRELTAPSWAECLYPQSPQTPTAETRAPGGGLGPTAVAECRPRGSHLAGYATQAAPDGARSGNLRGGPFTATVDTVSTADGATEVIAASEINDVTIGGVVTLRSIRNRALSSTTGRPGGAVAKAEATIGALLVNGEPVSLPSDSIQKLGPALAALGPVVAPAGTFTFDVVPELVEAASDGTRASARAAQITVTMRTGQLTVTFGLGYARAGARTIVNEPLGGGSSLDGGLGELPSPPASSAQSPAAGPPFAADPSLSFAAGVPSVAAAVAAGSGTGQPSPASLLLPVPAHSALPAAGTDAPSAALAPAPVLPPAAPATARSRGPAGPSKGTVSLLGVITAALLVRYLSYSTKLRRLEAAP
jgi:hypothetical protein